VPRGTGQADAGFPQMQISTEGTGRRIVDYIRCCGLAPVDADAILYANAPVLLGGS